MSFTRSPVIGTPFVINYKLGDREATILYNNRRPVGAVSLENVEYPLEDPDDPLSCRQRVKEMYDFYLPDELPPEVIVEARNLIRIFHSE